MYLSSDVRTWPSPRGTRRSKDRDVFFFDFPIPGVILRLSRLDIVRRVPIALIPVVFLPGLETLAN